VAQCGHLYNQYSDSFKRFLITKLLILHPKVALAIRTVSDVAGMVVDEGSSINALIIFNLTNSDGVFFVIHFDGKVNDVFAEISWCPLDDGGQFDKDVSPLLETSLNGGLESVHIEDAFESPHIHVVFSVNVQKKFGIVEHERAKFTMHFMCGVSVESGVFGVMLTELVEKTFPGSLTAPFFGLTVFLNLITNVEEKGIHDWYMNNKVIL